jgi:hypothetical protein
MSTNLPRLRGNPERIFISVDESTGKSTVSFAPADVGAPIQYDDDRQGTRAKKDADALSARYPGCTVHGPHFHAAPTGKSRPRRRAARDE